MKLKSCVTINFAIYRATCPLSFAVVHQFILQNEQVYVQVLITNHYSWSCGFWLFSFSFKKWSLGHLVTCTHVCFHIRFFHRYFLTVLPSRAHTQPCSSMHEDLMCRPTCTFKVASFPGLVCSSLAVRNLLVPRLCTFVACSTKFVHKAWVRSPRDVTTILLRMNDVIGCARVAFSVE